jgi:hypothetical protein
MAGRTSTKQDTTRLRGLGYDLSGLCFCAVLECWKMEKAAVERSEAEEMANAVARCHRELQQREKFAARLRAAVRFWVLIGFNTPRGQTGEDRNRGAFVRWSHDFHRSAGACGGCHAGRSICAAGDAAQAGKAPRVSSAPSTIGWPQTRDECRPEHILCQRPAVLFKLPAA